MSIYRELYFYLFAAAADAADLLERGDAAGALALCWSLPSKGPRSRSWRRNRSPKHKRSH